MDFGGCVICGAFWRPAAKLACRCGCASALAHGECRNGGFPDWLTEEFGSRLRSNDPGYLKEVRRLYQKIGEQAAGDEISQYLFIIGGSDIIPMPCIHHYIPNDSNDDSIDTDMLYATPMGRR